MGIAVWFVLVGVAWLFVNLLGVYCCYLFRISCLVRYDLLRFFNSKVIVIAVYFVCGDVDPFTLLVWFCRRFGLF